MNNHILLKENDFNEIFDEAIRSDNFEILKILIMTKNSNIVFDKLFNYENKDLILLCLENSDDSFNYEKITETIYFSEDRYALDYIKIITKKLFQKIKKLELNNE